MKKKVTAGIMAVMIAAGVCTAGTNDTFWCGTSIVASAAQTDSVKAPENVDVYGTSETAEISWWGCRADKYRIYIYNSKTRKYKKYRDTTDYSCVLTGLDSGTKYKIIVGAVGSSNGKTVIKKSKPITFTTKKKVNAGSVKAKDGTALDPKNVAYSDLTSKYGKAMLPENNKAYLLADGGSGTYAYGYLSGGQSEEYGFYTYIVHDGTVDAFPIRGYNFKGDRTGEQYFYDIDNDGEKEFISILPLMSGTYCDISSLVIYDKDKTGHYKAHTAFDNSNESFCETENFVKLMKKNVDVKINKKNGTVTFKSLNSKAVYTSKNSGDKVGSVSFISMCGGFYINDKGKLMMEFLPTSEAEEISDPYAYMPLITSEVKYDGKNFSLANTSFSEIDY